jgi:hypothetical protein
VINAQIKRDMTDFLRHGWGCAWQIDFQPGHGRSSMAQPEGGDDFDATAAAGLAGRTATPPRVTAVAG